MYSKTRITITVTAILICIMYVPSSISQDKTKRFIARCGDGICDDFEKDHPEKCPEDCGLISNQEITTGRAPQEMPRREGPFRSNMGRNKCGDEVCDDFEKRNPNLCPEDCQDAAQQPSSHSEPVSSDSAQKELRGVDTKSPFGIIPRLNARETVSYANILGFRSVRLAGPFGLHWDRQGKNEAEIDSDFRILTENNIEMSVVLVGCDPTRKGSLTAYSDYVSRVVERYDGDGYKDAPGSPVIAYLEIDNEPDLSGRFGWKGNIEEARDYALFLKTAYEAAKSASTHVKVAIGSMANNLEYFDALLRHLDDLRKGGERYFDVFNYHYYGLHKDYGLKDSIDNLNREKPGGISYNKVRGLLERYGYSGTGIIITEAGTYSGSPNPTHLFPHQSEHEQAVNLFKQYIFYISKGVERIYWNSVMSDRNNFFGHMALVRNGKKTLAFYTYKLMTEKLIGADWDKVITIRESDNVHIYRFQKKDLKTPVWIAWWDYWEENSAQKEVRLKIGNSCDNVVITEVVPAMTSSGDINESVFHRYLNKNIKPVQGGGLSLLLAKTPVFIEPARTIDKLVPQDH